MSGNAGPVFVSPGSGYSASGADTIVSGGMDTITMTAPGALVFGNTDDVITAGSADTVIAGNSDTIFGFGQGALIYAPAGGTLLVDDGGGSDTVVAQGGSAGSADTIFAAAGGTYFQGAPAAPSGPGLATSQLVFVNGGGASTLVGGVPGANETIATTVFGGSGGMLFVAGGSFVFDAPSGDDTIISGIAPPVSDLTGMPLTLSGTAYVGNGGVLTLMGEGWGNQLVAGSGSSTINGSLASSGNTYWAGSGQSVLIGGSGPPVLYPSSSSADHTVGSDVFVAGTGAATMVGSSTGFEAFAFESGHAGGTDLIENWNGHDQLVLFGYGAAPIASQAVAGGSTLLTLTDGTRITLAGITALNPAQVFTA